MSLSVLQWLVSQVSEMFCIVLPSFLKIEVSSPTSCGTAKWFFHIFALKIMHRSELV